MQIENFPTNENPNVFFAWLKKTSEKAWETKTIKSWIFGFQTQPKTRWLEGLTETEIKQFESELGFDFPEIYKCYLRNMNGTDRLGINIYGNEETASYAPNFYSFPRDLEVIKDRINWIYREFSVNEEEVKQKKIPHIIPIVSHRFLIADNCAENPVLSMYGNDVIIYAPNLQSFLAADIFQNASFVPTDSDYKIKLWVDDDFDTDN